jgi:hypothetical protein
MKTSWTFGLALGAALACCVWLGAGCVGVTVRHRSAADPGASVPVRPGDEVTLAEIDAASRLNMNVSRATALKAIASRPTLSPAAQVALVDSAYGRLDLESHRVSLLQAVIANPGFCDAAKHRIVTQLHRLAFSSHREEILASLNRRAVSGG